MPNMKTRHGEQYNYDISIAVDLYIFQQFLYAVKLQLLNLHHFNNGQFAAALLLLVCMNRGMLTLHRLHLMEKDGKLSTNIPIFVKLLMYVIFILDLAFVLKL